MERTPTGPADPNQYVRELGSSLGQKLTDLTDQVQAVVTELRANGVPQGAVAPARNAVLAARRRGAAAQPAARLAGSHAGGDQALATRASLVLPEAPAELVERLETLERAVSENPLENARSIGTVWRAAVVLLAIGIGVAGVLVSRLQGQVTAATARVSQAEQQAQVATKTATEQIAAAREEASQQIAQARDAAEKAQTISDVLAAPDLVRYNLVGGDATSSFSAQALWSRSRGLVFSESRLPPLPKDSTYQIWLLSAASRRASARSCPMPTVDTRWRRLRSRASVAGDRCACDA